MALGKNLKKRKLISTESDTEKKSSAKSKKSVKTDKELIAKPKSSTKSKAVAEKSKKATVKRKAPKTKKVAAKTKKPAAKKIVKKDPVQAIVPSRPVEERKPSLDPGLPIFIAKELHELKSSLRKRYEEDIDKLKGVVTQFVVLQIGGELYAVDIDSVKEVVPISDLSKTPNTPEHIQGIANVRGSTYVVFDLTKKFKLEIEESTLYLLVLENAGVAAALSLSHLPTTRKVHGDNISSKLNMIEDASLDVSYIKGLIQDQGQLIYYLDVIELIKNDKAIVVPDNLMNLKE